MKNLDGAVSFDEVSDLALIDIGFALKLFQSSTPPKRELAEALNQLTYMRIPFPKVLTWKPPDPLALPAVSSAKTLIFKR